MIHLTAAELAAWKAACEEATPGPWETGVNYSTARVHGHGWSDPSGRLEAGQCILCLANGAPVGQHSDEAGLLHMHRIDRSGSDEYMGDHYFRQAHSAATGGSVVDGCDEYGCGADPKDIRFIIAARAAIPRLLAYVEAVQPVLEAVAQEPKGYCDTNGGHCPFAACGVWDDERKPHTPECPTRAAAGLLLKEEE